ncbi:hypothetical protein [Methylomonas methanica]|uniref:Uncharacterized protein n=1 Tax=Methylomonas methanica (strain DSM 25384 / MC09) TaxID=857087 RepID=G0A4U7_METMM|nr:hypothetical protein [Methylomonas methanica]AEG02838.1 hypothetical protein Metme_4498 [Methylomonas methanica MC09]
MLAKRRGFYRDGKEIIRTPLLLPSFSSKGFGNIQNILKTTEEVIDGEILVSAYDIYHRNLEGPFDFAEAIFLDSGGYEAGVEEELASIPKHDHIPQPWNIEAYTEVVSKWQSSRPTVIISFDHPEARIDTSTQINRASETLHKDESIFSEILLKPEKESDWLVNVESVVKNIRRLEIFDSIGITEKEIGITQQERMTNIAIIRTALNNAGLGDKPIHVFGSLDTISTPLYFVAGADIFDGLTWLRFAYYNGMTIYKQNFATLQFGTRIKSHVVDGSCSYANYYYIKQMQGEMRNFLNNFDFNCFKHHKDIIEDAYKSVIEQLGGQHGR